jgi:hypothetical protein
MASSRINTIAEQILADGVDHTDRVFSACSGHSEAIAALSETLAQSYQLMAEIDTILARGGGALIRDYYRKG